MQNTKVVKPTFVIDKQKTVKNIKRMQKKAAENNLSFRPHFKTHQSGGVGEWFRECGIDKIAVSSVDMAMYFIKYAWRDITIAFPFNILETERINAVSEEIKLNLLIDSEETLRFLHKNLKRKVGIYIEIDISYGRSGISYKKYDFLRKLMNEITKSNSTELKGFLYHSGDTYGVKGAEKVLEIHNNNLQVFKELKERFILEFPEISITYGDTPTASIAGNFEFIDELRPGNFVYYDLMQSGIGSCRIEDISAYVLAPVVSIRKNENLLVLYCGAVHLSKEFLIENGTKHYGKVFGLDNDEKIIREDNSYIYSLSQEHGLVKSDSELIKNVKIGDLLAVYPVHSCLTANLLKETLIVKG